MKQYAEKLKKFLVDQDIEAEQLTFTQSCHTVKEAAAIMGVTPRFLQLALQQGRFPFGTAVKMKRWSYYIHTERFIQYMLGQRGEKERRKDSA